LTRVPTETSFERISAVLTRWPRTLLAAAMLFWAVNSIIGRALNETVPPVALAFWRWFFAGILLFPFAVDKLRMDWPVLRANLPLLLLLAALGVALFNTLLYIGLHSTTAINALLLQSLTPLVIVAASALLLREFIGARQITGLVLAFAGVLLIIARGDLSRLQTVAVNPGDIVIFIGVVGVAIYTVLLRKFPPVHALSFLAATIIIGTLQLAPFYAWELAGTSGFAVTPPVAGAIAYVAVFPSIVAYFGYNLGITAIGPNRAGMYIYLQPLFGSALAILFLGEALLWYHIAGGAVIAAGIALASRFVGKS
jgi:drug/metabolite transporter (DMT)-like permease